MAGGVTVNDDIKPHPKKKYALEQEDEVIVIQAGGGGFHSPLLREPVLVLEDVKEGWVTMKAADEVYGVVINPDDMTVDSEATNRRRS
jgi:N-methylhydantoinase B